MKLTPLLADVQTPSTSGARYAQATPGPGEAAAAGAALLERQSSDLARFETKRREQQQATEVAEMESTATRALGALELELQRGKRNSETGAIEAPPATDRDYLVRWREGWKKIQADAMGSTQDAQVQQAAKRVFKRIGDVREIRAQAYEGGLWLDREKAALAVLEEDYVNRAALDPNPDERRRAGDWFRALLATKTGTVLGEEEAEKRRQGFDEKVVEAEAGQAVRAGTFRVEDFAGRMNPVKLGQLADEHVRRTEHRDRKREQDFAEQRDQVFVALSAKIDANDMTREELQAYQDAWRFPPAQALALREKLNRTVEGESEPETLRALTMRARHPHAGTDDRTAVHKAYEERKLSRRDFEHLDAVVTQKIDQQEARRRQNESEARALAREARSDARERRAEGRANESERRYELARTEQRLRASLGIKSMFNDLNHEAENTVNLAMDELWRRYEGGESPSAIYTDILPRYLATNATAGLTRINAIRSALPVKTKAELAQARLSKRFGPDDRVYDSMGEQLRELVRIEEELVARAPAGGSGTKTPKSDMGRGGSAPAPAAPPPAPRYVPASLGRSGPGGFE